MSRQIVWGRGEQVQEDIDLTVPAGCEKHWRQRARTTLFHALGLTAGFAAVAFAAKVGLDKMDAYDLENCESAPHTYACQEMYAEKPTPDDIRVAYAMADGSTRVVIGEGEEVDLTVSNVTSNQYTALGQLWERYVNGSEEIGTAEYRVSGRLMEAPLYSYESSVEFAPAIK